jgi:hypothetical protein
MQGGVPFSYTILKSSGWHLLARIFFAAKCLQVSDTSRIFLYLLIVLQRGNAFGGVVLGKEKLFFGT